VLRRKEEQKEKAKAQERKIGGKSKHKKPVVTISPRAFVF
jgi:hypothetical protein